MKKWSRRESNPRPNIHPISFLHVYSIIICRYHSGSGQTKMILSCISFLLHAQPNEAAFCIFFESAARLGYRQACPAALMTTVISDYAAMAYEVLPFKSLNLQISVLMIQRTTCLLTLYYAVKTSRPRS